MHTCCFFIVASLISDVLNAMGIVTENTSSQEGEEEKILLPLYAVSCFPCLYLCQNGQHSFHTQASRGSVRCNCALQKVGKNLRQQECMIQRG